MDLENKKVLVRVDYNVPIKGGMVEDDTRLKATVPTINFLLEKNCKIILISHLGRPKKLLKKGFSLEEIKKKLTLNPVAEDLSEILGIDVAFVEEFIKATGQKKAKEILNRLWSNEQNKKDVHGIHGTLFYESLHKKPYYPDRTEKNMVVSL